MAVESTITEKSYKPGAAMAPEPLTGIKFFDPDELVVELQLDGEATRTELTRGVHYAIGGDGKVEAGTITASGTYAADDLFHVRRESARLQRAPFPAHEPLSSTDIRDGFDKLALIAQEQDREAARTFRVPRGENGAEVPLAAARAGLFAAYDDLGRPTVALGPLGDVPAISANITDNDGAGGALWTTVAGFIAYLRSSVGAALIGFLQSGAGAVFRPIDDKARDVLNVADFLPVGYVTDGSVDYTAEIQAAIDEAVESKRTLAFPNGTFGVSGTGLTVSLAGSTNLNIVGQGFANTIIRNSNGNVLRCQGQYLNVRDIQLVSAGGGHTIVQTGLLALCAWENVYLAQEADGYSVWDNAGHEFVENWFAYSVFQHKTTGTVHPFNLVGVGGIINNNSWFRCRADRCGTKHFFNVETTTANAQYANNWVGINFEVCRGGGIRLRGNNGFVIQDCQNWDAGAGAIVNHFYDWDTASGIGCIGRISDCGRWAGSFVAGKYDVKLPGGGGGNGIIIENCRTPGGGDPFTIDAANNGVFVSRVSAGITSVLNTAGMIVVETATSSIDVPAEYRVLGTKVVGARQAAVGDAVNAAAAPTQAEFNALVAKFNLLLDKLGTAGHGLTAD